MYDVTITRNAQRELDKMPATLIAALIEAVDQLGIYGAALQDPEVRYVGHGIRELRVCSPEGFGRAFYFFMKGRRIYMSIFCIRKPLKHLVRIWSWHYNA